MSKRRRKIVIYIEKDGELSLFHADVILKSYLKAVQVLLKSLEMSNVGG